MDESQTCTMILDFYYRHLKKSFKSDHFWPNGSSGWIQNGSSPGDKDATEEATATCVDESQTCEMVLDFYCRHLKKFIQIGPFLAKRFIWLNPEWFFSWRQRSYRRSFCNRCGSFSNMCNDLRFLLPSFKKKSFKSEHFWPNGSSGWIQNGFSLLDKDATEEATATGVDEFETCAMILEFYCRHLKKIIQIGTFLAKPFFWWNLLLVLFSDASWAAATFLETLSNALRHTINLPWQPPFGLKLISFTA